MIKCSSSAFKAVLVIGLVYSQNLSAENFTSAKVLDWPEASQEALFQNSITMIGIVASQVKPDIARCIDKWYGADEALGKKRYDEIRSALEKYPEYHPQAIVLAVVQKACGKFAS